MRAAALYEDAVRLDSTFTHAYFGLATALNNAGVGRGRSLEATVAAYRLRDRLSDSERHAATGAYFLHVVGDLPKVIEAIRNQIESAKPSGDFFLYAALGRSLALAGDLPGAEAALREATTVWPTAMSQHNSSRCCTPREGSGRQCVLREAMTRYRAITPHDHAGRSCSPNGDYAAAAALAGELPSVAGSGTVVESRRRALPCEVASTTAVGHFRVMRQQHCRLGSSSRRPRSPSRSADCISSGARQRRRSPRSKGSSPGTRWTRWTPSIVRTSRSRASTPKPVGRCRPGSSWRCTTGRCRWSSADRIAGRTSGRWPPSDSRGRAARRARGAGAREPRGPLRRAVLVRRSAPAARRAAELARAYDSAGLVDSTIATYERYVATRSVGRIRLDAFELPGALLRLAELHESRGDRAAAARHYLRFAELWQDADEQFRRWFETRERAPQPCRAPSLRSGSAARAEAGTPTPSRASSTVASSRRSERSAAPPPPVRPSGRRARAARERHPVVPPVAIQQVGTLNAESSASSTWAAMGRACRTEAIVLCDHGSRQLLRSTIRPRCRRRQGVRVMSCSNAPAVRRR